MNVTEHEITVGDRRVTCALAEPPRPADRPGLLMTFSMTRSQALTHDIYNIPARVFLDAGHRVLSFDLPHHGDRIGASKMEQIHGFRDAFLAGSDPFEEFILDGKAAIDLILEKRWAPPGRIVICGLSRAGYCSLRLFGVEPRLAAVCALAPVTDWRKLSEFETVADQKRIAELDLIHRAHELVGRPIFVAIGSADRRVGTERTAALVARIFELEAERNLDPSGLRVHFLHDSRGHGLEVWARAQGANYLLSVLEPRES